MKRALAERMLAQSKRIIEEVRQLIGEIEAGAFDEIIALVNTTRAYGIQEAEREIADHRRNIASWERIMQEHPDLFQ